MPTPRRDAAGRTPLFRAVQAGDQDAVEQLLLDDACVQVDLDARDHSGRTPLSHAAEHGHAGIASLLLSRGASPNLLDLRRASPLWYAAEAGHADVVAALLLGSRPRVVVVDVNVKPMRGGKYGDNTPLSVALRKGYGEIAGMLAREGGVNPHAEIQSGGWEGIITLLGLAARDGHEDAAMALLAWCGTGEGARCPEPGPEVLVLAAASGSARLVGVMLEKHHADPNAVYPYYGEFEFQGKTSLMVAAGRGHRAVVRLLLDADGIQLNAWCGDGTALSLAARRGFREVVKILVADERVEADKEDSEGRTPLSLAAMGPHEGVVEELLLMPEKVHPDGRGRGRTPLSWAVGPEYGYGRGGWQAFEGVVRLLLASPQVDPNSRPNPSGVPGDSPLSHAAQRGALGLVQAILDHPATDPDLPGAGITPLALAAAGRHLGVVMALIKTERVDLNAVSETYTSLSGQTVLTLAVEAGHESVVELLLSSPGIEPHKRNAGGKTPLAVAAQNGHASLVRTLLAVEGADPNSRDNDGRTPLSAAAFGGYRDTVDVARLLLSTKGTDPDAADIKGQTPLSIAAGGCRLELVDILLAADDVNPDSRDLVGRSPLSWALTLSPWGADYQKIDRQKQVIRRILRVQEVDPNAEDAEGLTPLIRAIQAEHSSEFVSLILERDDVDVHREGKNGRTPMELAKEHGDTTTISLLHARGARDEVCPLTEGPEHDSSIDDGVALEAPEEPEVAASDPPPAGGRRQRRRRSSRNRPARSPSYTRMRYGGMDVDESTKIQLRYELSRDVRLPLGVQEAHLDLAENDADLCPTCEAINLDELFSNRHTDYGGRLIASLGRVDETWETRKCPLCRLIAAVRPRSSSRSQRDDENSSHNLVTFSSTGTWLCHDMLISWQRFQGPWIDTMVLGVIEASERGSSHGFASHDAADSVLASGFIGRLGSNCPYGTHSIAIPRLNSSGVDLATAKGWITHCREEHSQRCNPRELAPVPHFRLIECSTGRIVEHAGSVPPYAALSYVWGPPRLISALPEQNRNRQEDGIGVAEPVVEDAIRVTLGLGYRYLWVDRHCIVQAGDDTVKQEQLRSMHHVYANAEVTLVAAAGQDSSFGLPGTAPLRPRAPQPSARVKGHGLTCIPPDPATLIEGSTWATRGWTYQEGLLARRRLFFTDREMSFECHDLLCREAIHLPSRVTDDMGGYDERRLMQPSWIYELGGVASSSAGGIDLFARLAEYTARRLTYPSDALNGMLGVLQVFAARARNPVHHLCGVPVLHATDETRIIPRRFRQRRRRGSGASAGRGGDSDDDDDDDDDAASLARAGFVNGLCWRLKRPAPRRELFPSWSWAGWHGVVDSLYGNSPGIAFEYGFDVDVSIVLKDDAVVPWSVYFDGLRGGSNTEKQPDFYCSQRHLLEITANVVTVRFRFGDEAFNEECRYTGTVCMGDGVWEGDFWPTRRDSASAEQVEPDDGGFGVGLDFQQKLLEESWLGIVLGNTLPPDREDNRTYVLIVEEQQPSTTSTGSYWERVGLLKLDHSTLEGGMMGRMRLRLI